MSEPEFTEFKNFQNNSGNSENSGQICANGGASLVKLCIPKGLARVNKTGKENCL
jgi:hypothetical protein